MYADVSFIAYGWALVTASTPPASSTSSTLSTFLTSCTLIKYIDYNYNAIWHDQVLCQQRCISLTLSPCWRHEILLSGNIVARQLVQTATCFFRASGVGDLGCCGCCKKLAPVYYKHLFHNFCMHSWDFGTKWTSWWCGSMFADPLI